MQDIYISDKGKGKSLVLIHGFLGSSKMWRPQIDFFQKYFRVITPDLPGFGKSNKVKSLSSIKNLASLLLEHLQRKKINKFYLLGHSMGGMIVQEIAKIAKSKVIKLVCYSTGPRGEMPGRFETVKQSRKNLKKYGLASISRNIAKTWFVKGENSEYFDVCLKIAKQTSVAAADNAMIAFQKWNNVKGLKDIKCKTLIVWGDKDKSYKLKQVETLKKNIENSKLIIFKNSAHNIHLEKSNKFNHTIKDFLLET